MPLHLSARIHAFAHGLFRPKDEKEVRAVEIKTQAAFMAVGLSDSRHRAELILDLAKQVAEPFGLDVSDDRFEPVLKLVSRLIDYESLFILPDIDWSQKYTVAQYWEIRDALSSQRALVVDFDQTCHLIKQLAGVAIQQLYEACPSLYDQSRNGDDITIQSDLLQAIRDLPAVTEAILRLPFSEDVVEKKLFIRLRDQLERNLITASGGNVHDPKSFNKAPRYPPAFDAKSPQHLIDSYLGATPLVDFFDQELPFTIPTQSRFEHHHIVAGSGHGKTQTLQYLISQDLEAVARGERSIVVIDSQGDLIKNISQLAAFAPGAPLHDRIVIIDPTDVEYPVSLNLFDVGMERMEGYAPLERERLTNSILELYDFVLGTLLDAQMTQKQSVIFRFVTRLMLHIPGATIHTLRELMEPDAEIKFAEHIAKLSGTSRHFFETEFSSREFEQTKRQVLRRLWGILENQTFERMFSHPRSKLDMFSEMNAGKVILINTAKDLLKETGTEIFGRFFIAMIAQAAQERSVMPREQRMPTFVYIDEAADYFDRNIGIILAQARKYNVGMILAHQYLGQLDPGLQDAFGANTSIKFAGGVSAKDARSLAPMLYTESSFIESQPKGSYAAHIQGVTKGALPLRFPFGYLEDLPRLDPLQRQALQTQMRSKYAVHYSELANSASGSVGRFEEKDDHSAASDQNAEKPGHIDTDAGTEW